MKRAKEIRIEAKSGDRENVKDSEVQTTQEKHPLMSPLSSPVSPVSSPGNQMQAALPSPPPLKEGGCLHYVIVWLVCADVL